MTEPQTTDTTDAETEHPEVLTEAGNDVVATDTDHELAVTDREDSVDDTPLARQAAKWRRCAKELEAEREQLAERVTALQRQHIEALATDAGLKHAALWAVTTVEDLLNDDGTGTVSAGKVKDAIKTASETLGVRPQPAKGLYGPAEGGNPSATPQSGRTAWTTRSNHPDSGKLGGAGSTRTRWPAPPHVCGSRGDGPAAAARQTFPLVVSRPCAPQKAPNDEYVRHSRHRQSLAPRH